MTDTDHPTLIADWIDATNSYDTARYLSFFSEEAILDDPSVGGEHRGHSRIQEYFENWFVGLNTRTRLLDIEQEGDQFRVTVHFTGDFPEGEADGEFVVVFDDRRFSRVSAALG